MSDAPQGDGWWQASDGKWYSPAQATPPAQPTPPTSPDLAPTGVMPPVQAPLGGGVPPMQPPENGVPPVQAPLGGGVPPMQPLGNPDEEGGKGKGKLIALLLLLLLLVIAVVAAGVMFLGGDDDDAPLVESSASVTTAPADIGEATGELTDDGPIKFDTDYEDALEGTRTEGRYTIDAPDGAIMTVTVINKAESERAVHASFESSGQRFANFRTQPGATESEVVALADNGGAPFELIFTEGPAAYTFRIDLEVPSDGGQEGDAGSEFATAFAVEAGQAVAGKLAGADTADHYTIELEPGSEFTFAAAVERTSERAANFTVELEGTRLFSGRVQPGADTDFSLLLSNDDEGTLEIIVTEGPASYSYTANFVDLKEGGEAGDAPAELANARTITPATPVEGQVGGRDAGDYYVFKAPLGSITFTAESDATSERAFLVTIEDASGSRADSFRVQPGTKADTSVEVEAGSTVRLIVTEGPAKYSISIG